MTTVRADLDDAVTVTSKIRADVQVWGEVWQRRPGIALLARLLLLEPGFQLAFSIRLQEWAGHVPIVGRALRRCLWYVTTMRHGCDIDPQAVIGAGLYLPHPLGIVIGGATRIGRNVRILQGVTLGRGERSPACPWIGDGARLCAGAQIVGGVRVGAGASIGANAVVLTDVAAGHVAMGVPARSVAP